VFGCARVSTLNQTSLTVAIVDGQAGVPNAFRLGANLVLTKPVPLGKPRTLSGSRSVCCDKKFEQGRHLAQVWRRRKMQSHLPFRVQPLATSQRNVCTRQILVWRHSGRRSQTRVLPPRANRRGLVRLHTPISPLLPTPLHTSQSAKCGLPSSHLVRGRTGSRPRIASQQRPQLPSSLEPRRPGRRRSNPCRT
jgi:hypothetical protein